MKVSRALQSLLEDVTEGILARVAIESKIEVSKLIL
jgi:hypothetical protein